MPVQNKTIKGIPMAQYWSELRRKSISKNPLKRTPIKKKAYKIKKRSKKLSAEERVHAVLKKDFLLDYPICQCGRKDAEGNICQLPATDVHHKKGRGKWLNVVKYFLAVSRVCHRWIELHPKEAKELGLSVNRID